MPKGVLVDLTKCVGCGSCTVACKLYNKLPFKTPKTDEVYLTHSESAENNGYTWTVVSHHASENHGHKVWRYVKEQCMHCKEPACASSCFSKALTLNKETGAVHYNPELCVGCRYCMLACPFSVPKYEWNKAMPSISKCNFCNSKIANGEYPSCVAACPTGCLTYGERDELLIKAQSLIKDDAKYVKHIYGESEAGGTSWIYLSDVPFESIGFNMNVPKKSIPKHVNRFTKYIPFIFAGSSVLWAGSYLYTKRREAVAKNEKGGESYE